VTTEDESRIARPDGRAGGVSRRRPRKTWIGRETECVARRARFRFRFRCAVIAVSSRRASGDGNGIVDRVVSRGRRDTWSARLSGDARSMRSRRESRKKARNATIRVVRETHLRVRDRRGDVVQFHGEDVYAHLRHASLVVLDAPLAFELEVAQHRSGVGGQTSARIHNAIGFPEDPKGISSAER